MNILLLGKNGQIGWELERTLAPLGTVIAYGRAELNLTDEKAIRQSIRNIKPDLIVNAAGYTAVDQAEEESELAMAVNATAPGILAEEAASCGARLVHYSTDYIFDGAKKEPYLESDSPNPLNVYGHTKLAGEQAIIKTDATYLILRTSWIYGTRGSNFLLTMLRLAEEHQMLKVVNDQIGAPTWCRQIAEATASICARQYDPNQWKNIYHITAAGQTSWAGFAKEIFEDTTIKNKPKPVVIPIGSKDYNSKAIRPANSLLSSDKLYKHFGIRLPDWSTSFRQTQDHGQ